MDRITIKAQSIRRCDIDEDTTTDTERRRRRETSITISQGTLCVERDRQGETPCGAEIVPDAGPMPPIPRLSGDSAAEPDA